jgi:hypothetical protein
MANPIRLYLDEDAQRNSLIAPSAPGNLMF